MKNLWTKLLAALLIATLLLTPVAMMEENPSEVPAVTEAEPIEANAIDEVVEEVAIDALDAIAEEGLFELGEDDSELSFEEFELSLDGVTDPNSPHMLNINAQSTVIVNTNWDGHEEGIYPNVASLQAAIDAFKADNPGKTITTLDIQQLDDLTGLDTLTSLSEVQIGNSGVSTIDFSKNNELTEISLWGNAELSTLTLGNQPKLNRIYCTGGKLTSLDVSGCTLIKPFVNDAHKTVMEDNTIVYSQDNPAELTDRSTNPWLQVDGTVTVTGGEASETVTSKTTETPTVVSAPTGPAITISKAPAKVKAKAAKKGKVTVSWKKIKKTKKTKALLKQINGIEVQISTDPTFTTDVQTKNLGKKKTKVTIKGLQKKTFYYVRVRYTDAAGGVSKWSATKKVKTKKK